MKDEKNKYESYLFAILENNCVNNCDIRKEY